MAELTISQLIKMLLFVAVIVVVITGAYLGFRNYVIPYFEDLGPSERELDLSTPYYQDLMREENLAGVTVLKEGYLYFSVKEGGATFGTSYYLDDGSIYIAEGEYFGFDEEIGEIDKSSGKIKIFDEWLDKDMLLKNIDGGEKIGNEIYKIRARA